MLAFLLFPNLQKILVAPPLTKPEGLRGVFSCLLLQQLFFAVLLPLSNTEGVSWTRNSKQVLEEYQEGFPRTA